MKMKFIYLTLLPAILLFSHPVFGQTTGDYQSFATGDWNNTANWERWDGASWVNPAPSAPTSADGAITILNTHTITVGAAPESADQLTINAGGTLVINNILTIDDGTGTDLSSLGTVTLLNTLQTGTGTPSADFTLLNWTGGTLDVPTSIGVGGTLNISGANKILSTTLTNNGTLNWTASLITFDDATLNNNFIMNASGVTAFVSGGTGANIFNNNGAFGKTTNAGSVTFNIPVNNTGTIGITAGTLISTSANGSFTNSGAIGFAGGIGLTLSGTGAGGNQLNPGTAFSGPGIVTISSATDINLVLNLPSTINFILSSVAMALGGTGSLDVDGPWTWNSGTLLVPTTVNSSGTLTLTGTSTKLLSTTLTNNGTIDWTGLNLPFTNGTLDNNGTITVSGNSSFTLTAGTNVFNNNATGTFTKNSAGTTSFVSIPVNNSGTINVAAGTLSKTGLVTVGFNNTGTIDVSAGAIFVYSAGGVAGLFTLDPGTVISGSGIFRMNSNTVMNIALSPPATLTTEIGISGAAFPVTGSGSLTINGTLNWGVGTMNVPLTIASGAVFNSTAGKSMAANLTNNGTINLTDPVTGSISLANSTFTNTTSGIINDNYSTAARTFANGGGTNSFTNNGLYAKSSNAFATAFAVPVINSATGTFAGIGTITFSSTIANSGFLSPGISGLGILATSANAVTGNTPTIQITIIDGSGPGTGHDRLDMTGITNLSGSTLVISDPASAPFPVSYVVMTAPGPNGFVGTFANVIMPAVYTLAIDNASNPSTVTVTKTAAILPLVWGKFTALAKDNKVNLDWSTFQEENTSHFLIEHSVDAGRIYNTIGTVPAAGNSGSELFYSFTHRSPDLNKTNFYRILQVDQDGNSKYSSIRTVRFDNGRAVTVLVTPNPVRNVMQLSVQGENINIMLTGINGAVLRTWKLQPGFHQIPMDNLPAGHYQLNIYQKDQPIGVQKIIKL